VHKVLLVVQVLKDYLRVIQEPKVPKGFKEMWEPKVVSKGRLVLKEVKELKAE
jgi:hypothetical protein